MTPLALGRREWAKALGISVASFDRRVADGSLPQPRRLGGRALWLQAEVEAALAALPVGVNPARSAQARAGKAARRAAASK